MSKVSQGMTLMSVMVATALAGVVAVAVVQLLSNQTKAMRTISLREERENLIKYYKNVVISGWDYTLDHGGGGGRDIYGRDGSVKIPSGGLCLQSYDLYGAGVPCSGSSGWWKVTTLPADYDSGLIRQSDSWRGTDIQGSGLHTESLRAVIVKVEFIRKYHPTINTDLETREEIVFLHHSDRLASSTSCSNTSHKTRLDTRTNSSGSAEYPHDPLPFSSGYESAVIQYDFNSNYVKCSQVPLIKPSESCKSLFDGTGKKSGAVIGFWEEGIAGSSCEEFGSGFVTGSAICSSDGDNAVNDAEQHPYLSTDYITMYLGSDDSDAGTYPDTYPMTEQGCKPGDFVTVITNITDTNPGQPRCEDTDYVAVEVTDIASGGERFTALAGRADANADRARNDISPSRQMLGAFKGIDNEGYFVGTESANGGIGCRGIDGRGDPGLPAPNCF